MSNDNELWKNIDERYQISNQGRVKSLIGEEKILKPTPDGKGYFRVKLSRKPEVKGRYFTKDYRIHRLVAKFFCEGYAEEKEVHHRNLNRQDNRASNLVCLTKAEHAELHRQLREQEKKQAAEAKGVSKNENSPKPKNNNG